jgi:DNA-binding NarL/FixJ family response regulator
MTVDGMRTKEIAFALDISVKTVETYRSQIMAKLGLQDIPSLVRYAIRNGITEL